MCEAAVSPVRLQAYPGQGVPDVLPVCRNEGRGQSDVDTMSGKGKGLRKILKFPVMGTGVRDKGAPRLFFLLARSAKEGRCGYAWDSQGTYDT